MNSIVHRVHSVYKHSLAQRREARIPTTRWLVIRTVVWLVFYVLLAVIIAPDSRPEYHFVSESGAITALSAIALAMASAFAGTSFFLSRRSADWSRYFWLLAALGLGFFSLDELLQFHEQIGVWITQSKLGPTQIFRNWDDVVVLGYGTVGIIAMIFFLPEILRYPRFAELLTVAFAFYCIHTVIDSISEPRTALSILLEETAKLFSSAFIAISMFVGLLGIVVSISRVRR